MTPPRQPPDARKPTPPAAAGSPSVDDGGLPLIACIAEGLAAVSAPQEFAMQWSPTDRRELLLSTDQYDAWLIHLPVGASLPPHHHAGSAGAVSVVSGTLEEDTVSDGVTATRPIEAGTTMWFDADHVHALSNRGGIEATSVHVYAPPLRAARDDAGARQAAAERQGITVNGVAHRPINGSETA